MDRLSPETFAELLALLVHDLRNPLSALRSNVGYLSGADIIDSEAREAVIDAEASCDGLAHILDNMEVFGHSLSGRSALPPSLLSLASLVRDTAAQCESFARSYGVKLEVDPGVAVSDARVRAHREMLGRALANVVRNSIQHAGAGAVKLSIRVDGSSATIEVRDRGPVLASAGAHSPFSAIGQLMTKHHAEGRYSRGLGLYCAKIAADVAGATLSARAAPDGGNLFEITVPLG